MPFAALQRSSVKPMEGPTWGRMSSLVRICASDVIVPIHELEHTNIDAAAQKFGRGQGTFELITRINSL